MGQLIFPSAVTWASELLLKMEVVSEKEVLMPKRIPCSLLAKVLFSERKLL